MPKKRTSPKSTKKTLSKENESSETLDEEEGFKIKIGPEHLTRFERSRIIGAIALQISMGAPILIELEDETDIDPIEVAILELKSGVLPLTIRRTKPSGEYQDIPLPVLLKNPLSFR
ncbi:MAG: DNA-directed RNA polymerase subunit K [Candidatus Helarchaeota archaeon]